MLTWIMQWLRQRSQRAELAQLDARLLRDIGLTRTDVANGTGRPFWEV